MLSATLYITICSTKNRMGRWLRRLREPRYLVGFILATAYLYVALFARSGVRRGGRGVPVFNTFPSLSGLAPLGLGAALMVAAAACWLLPTSGRLLEFAPAEVQFLFPAPAGRRSLLLYRLMRSQAGLLFASLIPALAFSIPSGSATLALRAVLSIWMLLVAARVYFSAIALSRTRLSSPNPRLRLLARLPLVLVLLGLAAVGVALVRSQAWGGEGVSEIADGVAGVLSSGAPHLLMWPFVTLVRPFFAPGWSLFGLALLKSAAVTGATMVWLMAADEVFQGASLAIVESQDSRPSTGRATYVARPLGWTLAPTGRPEQAFIWKTTLQMFRVVDRRVLTRLAIILFTLSLLVVVSSRTRSLAGIGGVFSMFGAIYTILVAPQILRLDIRQDLQHLELLKTWPVRGAEVVRGEITAPALALTAGAWLLTALALLFSTAAFPRVALTWRLAWACGGAIAGPALIFSQYAIHNAMALVFPAWVPLGMGRPRGLDAMGQRLLTLGATWVGLAVMVLPGGLVSWVLWLAFYRTIGAAMIAVGASVSAAAMALEVLALTEALGPAYDRLDLLGIERPD